MKLALDGIHHPGRLESVLSEGSKVFRHNDRWISNPAESTLERPLIKQRTVFSVKRAGCRKDGTVTGWLREISFKPQPARWVIHPTADQAAALEEPLPFHRPTLIIFGAGSAKFQALLASRLNTTALIAQLTGFIIDFPLKWMLRSLNVGLTNG